MVGEELIHNNSLLTDHEYRRWLPWKLCSLGQLPSLWRRPSHQTSATTEWLITPAECACGRLIMWGRETVAECVLIVLTSCLCMC